MRIVLTIIIIVLVIVGLALLLFETDIMPTNTTVSTSTDSVNTTDQTDEVSWQTYQVTVASSTLTFGYPATAVASALNDTGHQIKYLGPNNMPNTEITDGYYITIMFTDTADLDAYVENESPISDVRNITFNGVEAVSYTTRSALGTEDTNTVYRPYPDSDWIVDITYTIFGSEYQSTVTNILQTISISADDE